MYEDELDKEVKAFFEASSSSTRTQESLSIARRLDNIIEGLKTTLPYVRHRTMEFIDRAAIGGEDRDIHTYLKSVKVDGKGQVPCAFSTFERFKVNALLLHQIFDMIGDENKSPDDILNVRESREMKL